MASPFGPGAGDAGDPLANLQATLNASGGAGAGSFIDPSDPLVRLAPTSTRVLGNKPMPGGGRLKSQKVSVPGARMPVSQAQASIYSWTQDEWEALAKRLWYLGYDGVSDPSDIQGAIKVWQAAVDEAAKMQAGGHDMSPDDVLDMYAAANKPLATKRSAGDVQTSKARSISLTDPTQARALITQAFQQAMGRNPTDAEVRVLTSSLNDAERKNPTVTTQSPRFDNEGNPIPGETNTVTGGGIDPSAFIQQAAQADPEAAEYQAGTFYFNTLMKALGSPVG